MTYVILQDNSESAQDQSRAAEHQSRSGEDLIGRELQLAEDPSTQVPQRQWTSKIHCIPAHLVSTNTVLTGY
jgi:hypothetical protein